MVNTSTKKFQKVVDMQNISYTWAQVELSALNIPWWIIYHHIDHEENPEAAPTNLNLLGFNHIIQNHARLRLVYYWVTLHSLNCAMVQQIQLPDQYA